MSSFLSNLFTVTGNNNTMYSKDRIGKGNFDSKISVIVFQINSISLIESEEFRETLINLTGTEDEARRHNQLFPIDFFPILFWFCVFLQIRWILLEICR